jgi:hypothetical protein
MHDELLTIEELDARTRALAVDRRVTVTPLGVSRLGRSIDMVSLGDGPHQALVVGVPHPNEPIGAVTVERMIALLLDNEDECRGYRWNFIKAIDPEGLKLNGGWLKKPRTIVNYLHDFFRPALHRQPETTFPLSIPECHFDASMPENLAWQRAFALTRPRLHASLHHLDFGGCFYSFSRALPAAIGPLEGLITESGLGVHDVHDGVMAAERWTSAIDRYPAVPELIANARAAGAKWADPWTVGEMSPGYGETHYGSFTLIAEVPLWDAPSLHDTSPSGITEAEQEARLRSMSAAASEAALRHVEGFAGLAIGPDAQECLSALHEGLKMIPAAGPAPEVTAAAARRVLSRREFELHHTRPALFVLRTYGLLHRLASLVLLEEPGHPQATRALEETQAALRRETALLEGHTTFAPVPVEATSRLQMQAIFACAAALAGSG